MKKLGDDLIRAAASFRQDAECRDAQRRMRNSAITAVSCFVAGAILLCLLVAGCGRGPEFIELDGQHYIALRVDFRTSESKANPEVSVPLFDLDQDRPPQFNFVTKKSSSYYDGCNWTHCTGEGWARSCTMTLAMCPSTMACDYDENGKLEDDGWPAGKCPEVTK